MPSAPGSNPSTVKEFRSKDPPPNPPPPPPDCWGGCPCIIVSSPLPLGGSGSSPEKVTLVRLSAPTAEATPSVEVTVSMTDASRVDRKGSVIRRDWFN